MNIVTVQTHEVFSLGYSDSMIASFETRVEVGRNQRMKFTGRTRVLLEAGANGKGPAKTLYLAKPCARVG